MHIIIRMSIYDYIILHIYTTKTMYIAVMNDHFVKIFHQCLFLFFKTNNVCRSGAGILYTGTQLNITNINILLFCDIRTARHSFIIKCIIICS